jgi:hypothetical protein
MRSGFGVGLLTAAALGLSAWAIGDRLQNWIDVTPVAAQTIAAPANAAWTAVGSSGTVDESSIPFFGFTGASAGYGPNGSVAPLEFRYNVVNIHHVVSAAGAIPSVAMPGWTVMEFGAQAPYTSLAEAYLYRVNRCTGQQTLICQVRHYNQPAPGICKPCSFVNSTFNFSSYLYYVRVVLDRNTPYEQPMAHTLRIY